MLRDHHLRRAEARAQNLDRAMRLGRAAHEDVERGIAGFRPGVDRDVRLRQHRHAGNTVVRREMMQVDVQQRRLGRLDAFAQSVLDVGEIVDALGAPKVDDKMRSGETLAVALNKRSEEHTSELQSLMRISYAVFCLKKKKTKK